MGGIAVAVGNPATAGPYPYGSGATGGKRCTYTDGDTNTVGACMPWTGPCAETCVSVHAATVDDDGETRRHVLWRTPAWSSWI